MTAAQRTALLAAVNAVTNADPAMQARKRAQTALYIVATSPCSRLTADAYPVTFRPPRPPPPDGGHRRRRAARPARALGALGPARRGRRSTFRAMVGVFLFGGADNWNMIVPTDAATPPMPPAAAPPLALPQASLTPLPGVPFGLHPSFAPLQHGVERGRAGPGAQRRHAVPAADQGAVSGVDRDLGRST